MRGAICLFFWILVVAPGAGADDASRVPAFILDVPPSTGAVFVADTGSARIYQFVRNGDDLEQAHDGYMSIGQNGVGKQRAWDRRTPLGIYFVVDQLDTSKLHERYGVTAFPLDYPNTWDRRLERTGDGIWVHGVLPDSGQRPPRDTDGCIALPNEDLRKLEDDFVPLETPVIVTREMRWSSPADVAALRDELRDALDDWARHKGDADLHAYLSMYASEFTYRGMKLSEWASFQVQSMKDRGNRRVELSHVLLLADPEEPGLYLSRFEETISSENTSSTTTKRLYWRRSEKGTWSIVAEDNG